MANPDGFQRRLHDADLNRGSSSGLIVMKAVAIQNGSFLIPYFCEVRFTSMDWVPDIFGDVSIYCLYVSDAESIKGFANKWDEPSSKKRSEKDQKEEENQGVYDMEIVEVPRTNKTDAVSDKNYNLVNVFVFNVSDYHQSDLFVRIGCIASTDIHLRDISLSHVTMLRASFQDVWFRLLPQQAINEPSHLYDLWPWDYSLDRSQDSWRSGSE